MRSGSSNFTSSSASTSGSSPICCRSVMFTLLADLQLGLVRGMAAHLGGRRVDPQVFAGQPEARAVVEGDLQHAGLLVQVELGGERVLVHAIGRQARREVSSAQVGRPPRLQKPPARSCGDGTGSPVLGDAGHLGPAADVALHQPWHHLQVGGSSFRQGM
jgi:hypothetical protein